MSLDFNSRHFNTRSTPPLRPDAPLKVWCARLAKIQRPSLLMRAVRYGLTHYARTEILRAFAPDYQTTADMIETLFRAEQQIERARQRQDGHYRADRHIQVLVALTAEIARLRAEALGAKYRRDRPEDPPNPRQAPKN